MARHSLPSRIWLTCGLSAALLLSWPSLSWSQVGFGIPGYPPGFGVVVPGYSSGINLSVGPGIGFQSGYGYTTYGWPPSGYAPGYGYNRPYGGYGPIYSSPYGLGYSYVGRPIFRGPIIGRSMGFRRRF